MRQTEFKSKKQKLRRIYKQIDDSLANFKLQQIELRLKDQIIRKMGEVMLSLDPDADLLVEIRSIERDRGLSHPEQLTETLIAILRKDLAVNPDKDCPVCRGKRAHSE